MENCLRELIPPYAILLHAWGEVEGRVQDLQNGAKRSNTGYATIRGCYEVAASC